MSVPYYQGDAAKQAAERMNLTVISNYLHSVSAYTIIVVKTDEGVDWVDVNNMSLPSRIKAEEMMAHFFPKQ